MSERAEQMYWVHNRGLVITLPPQATEAISRALIEGTSLPSEESQRLRLITEDPILRKRYPTSSDGEEYMNRVDLGWRDELYEYAKSTTTQIIEGARSIGKANAMAVLLFGSVAKALPKSKTDFDPSNIDITVIGNFNEGERTELFDFIRPVREKFQEVIGNNVGVHIQTPDKLIVNDYSGAINYIGSAAQALYDPVGLWSNIEQSALRIAHTKHLERLSKGAWQLAKRFYYQNGQNPTILAQGKGATQYHPLTTIAHSA